MNKEFITLATLTYMRAQLLCARLEEKHIACFMTHVNRIKEGPGGVEIIIRAKDAEKAFSIRDDFLKAYGSEKQPAVNFMRIARRILVPYDFSPHAENAALYALKIATKMKADIQLLHVYFDPGVIPFSQFESFNITLFPDDTEKAMEKETAEKLEAFSNRLKAILKQHRIKGVNIFYDWVKGSTINNILSYIKIYKPGIVIMGTRGSERESFRLLGSVTAKIMKKANVPVLAVPKDYSSTHLTPPKKVLYATELNASDYWALSKLSTFVKPFGAKIFCLHISEEIEKSEEVYLHKLKNFMQKTLGVEKLECGLLECLDPQLGLDDFIKEKEIDLVVMTTRQHRLISRFYTSDVSQKFLFQSSIPLMVFHALR